MFQIKLQWVENSKPSYHQAETLADAEKIIANHKNYHIARLIDEDENNFETELNEQKMIFDEQAN